MKFPNVLEHRDLNGWDAVTYTVTDLGAEPGGTIMLFTSDRKASTAKRAFMVCMFVITLGTMVTMIVDNGSVQPVEVGREGPLRRLVCFVLAAGLFCGGLYILLNGTAVMLLVGALLISAGAGWLWEDFLAPRPRRPTSHTI